MGDPGVERAGEGDAFRAGEVLRAGRHRGEHLHADSRRIHVGDPPGREVEELRPATAAREQALFARALEAAQFGRGEVLFQGYEEELRVAVGGAPRGGERQRRGGEADTRSPR